MTLGLVPTEKRVLLRGCSSLAPQPGLSPPSDSSCVLSLDLRDKR